MGDIRNSGEMEIKHYTVSKLSSDSSKGKSREKDQQLSRHLAVPLDVVSVDTVKNYLLRAAQDCGPGPKNYATMV